MSIEMSVEKKRAKKYEWVAPDGGWGWMVCVASVINYTTTTGFAVCFGLIYNDYMNEIEFGTTGVTLLSGLSAVSMAFTGVLITPLLKIMSLRQLSFMGTAINCSGILLTAFFKSVYVFYLSAGVIQGVAFGILYTLNFALLNEYFVVKRLFAMSLVQTVAAIIATVTPQFITFCLSQYGYRGTLLIIAGLSMNSFAASALMQPVKWHMKKVEIEHTGEELQDLLVAEKQGDSVEVRIIEQPDPPALIDDEINETEIELPKKSWFKRMIDELVDAALVKTYLFTNAPYAMAITSSVDSLFVLFLPQALYSYGWTEDNVGLVLSLLAFGDLTGRACFILLSKWLIRITNETLFIFGLTISGTAKVGMLIFPKTIATFVFTTMFGISFSFSAIISPLVITDDVGPEKFTSAMGIIMMLMGILNLFGGPALGVVRDTTDSYEITFWIIAGATVACTVSWIIEVVMRRLRRKIKNKK